MVSIFAYEENVAYELLTKPAPRVTKVRLLLHITVHLDLCFMCFHALPTCSLTIWTILVDRCRKRFSARTALPKDVCGSYAVWTILVARCRITRFLGSSEMLKNGRSWSHHQFCAADRT